jgi:hypothetical protein
MSNYFLLLRYKNCFLRSLFSSAYFNKSLEAFSITKTGNVMRLLPVKKAFMISILVLLLTKVTALSQQGSPLSGTWCQAFSFTCTTKVAGREMIIYTEILWQRRVAPQLYSRGWVGPIPDSLLLRKSGNVWNRTQISELQPGTLTTRPQKPSYYYSI